LATPLRRSNFHDVTRLFPVFLVLAGASVAGPVDPPRAVVERVVRTLEAEHRPDFAQELRALAPAPPEAVPRPWMASTPPRLPELPVPLYAVSEFLQDLGRTEDLTRLLAAVPDPPPLWVARSQEWLAQARGLRTLGNLGGPRHDWRLWLGDELRRLEPGPGEDGRAWVRALTARAWVAAPTTNPQLHHYFLRRVLAEGQRLAGFFSGRTAGPEEAELLLLLARNLSRKSGSTRVAVSVYQVLVARTRHAFGPGVSRRVRQAGDLSRRELAALWAARRRPDRAARLRRDQLFRTRAGVDVGRSAVDDRRALAALLGDGPEAKLLRDEADEL
jgi:hypothetical protein